MAAAGTFLHGSADRTVKKPVKLCLFIICNRLHAASDQLIMVHHDIPDPFPGTIRHKGDEQLEEPSGIPLKYPFVFQFQGSIKEIHIVLHILVHFLSCPPVQFLLKAGIRPELTGKYFIGQSLEFGIMSH